MEELLGQELQEQLKEEQELQQEEEELLEL
jgi:hypothetical protein